MPVALLALATVGATAASIQQTRQAGKQAKRQFEAEQRKAEIENVRNVRQQVRQARLAQAAMLNTAAVGNTMGSSGVLGGMSSIGSQLQGNLGFMSDIATENTAISSAAISAAGASSRAQVFGQIGQLAGTIFSDMGGFNKMFPAESELSKQATAQVARGLRPTAGGL